MDDGDDGGACDEVDGAGDRRRDASLSIVGLMALMLARRWASTARSRRRSAGAPTRSGVRRALGARDRDVVQLVVSDAMRLVIAGAGLGLAAGLAAAPLVRSLLYHVDRFDPVVFGIAPLVLIAVCVVASSIPTWRALRINAATALRYE